MLLKGVAAKSIDTKGNQLASTEYRSLMQNLNSKISEFKNQALSRMHPGQLKNRKHI